MAQTNSWRLWASGLPSGVYPKLSVAPNHDIYYGLTGTGGAKGFVYKANTNSALGMFTPLPQIPFPPSATNNIQTIICNLKNEPIIGIFRSNSSEPFLFRFDSASQSWQIPQIDYLPNLGAFCNAISPNGTIWVGTKWAYIYKSTDNGLSFNRIDETTILKNQYPCYYPSWSGNSYDGAIYSINVDKNGRLYAGTEGAGVIFSDDNGLSWHPADLNACKSKDATQKDSSSSMVALSNTGNLGAIGFTADNNVIFNGTSLWAFNWQSSLAFADLKSNTISQAQGIVPYFISTGLQITKIVTNKSGEVFLHSGINSNVLGDVGIYTSLDGIHWRLFNSGITSGNNGQAQGSLAVDGNKVFMATTDGKIWIYDAMGTTGFNGLLDKIEIETFPSPAVNYLHFSKTLDNLSVFNLIGQQVLPKLDKALEIDISSLHNGLYFLCSNEVRIPFIVEH